MLKTIAAATLTLFTLLVGEAHAQMRALTREDLRPCAPALARRDAYMDSVGLGPPAADPVGNLLENDNKFQGLSAERAAMVADFYRTWQPVHGIDDPAEFIAVTDELEECLRNVWLDVYEQAVSSASLGQTGGAPSISGATDSATAEYASQAGAQSARRGLPPQISVVIVQRLGDGRCQIEARVAGTRWENEDDPSNTRIVTDLELAHQCAVSQLIRDVISPCDNDTSERYCLPPGLSQGGLTHAWPPHIHPSSVTWTPEIGSPTAPTPQGWTLSRTVTQDARTWSDIRIQIASCDAFTANGSKRALLLEAGYNFATGFRGVACETIPPQ